MLTSTPWSLFKKNFKNSEQDHFVLLTTMGFSCFPKLPQLPLNLFKSIMDNNDGQILFHYTRIIFVFFHYPNSLGFIEIKKN